MIDKLKSVFSPPIYIPSKHSVRRQKQVAQRFLSANDQINTAFRPRLNTLSTASYRHARADVFGLWHDYTGEMNA